MDSKWSVVAFLVVAVLLTANFCKQGGLHLFIGSLMDQQVALDTHCEQTLATTQKEWKKLVEECHQIIRKTAEQCVNSMERAQFDDWLSEVGVNRSIEIYDRSFRKAVASCESFSTIQHNRTTSKTREHCNSLQNKFNECMRERNSCLEKLGDCTMELKVLEEGINSTAHTADLVRHSNSWQIAEREMELRRRQEHPAVVSREVQWALDSLNRTHMDLLLRYKELQSCLELPRLQGWKKMLTFPILVLVASLAVVVMQASRKELSNCCGGHDPTKHQISRYHNADSGPQREREQQVFPQTADSTTKRAQDATARWKTDEYVMPKLQLKESSQPTDICLTNEEPQRGPTPITVPEHFTPKLLNIGNSTELEPIEVVSGIHQSHNKPPELIQETEGRVKSLGMEVSIAHEQLVSTQLQLQQLQEDQTRKDQELQRLSKQVEQYKAWLQMKESAINNARQTQVSLKEQICHKDQELLVRELRIGQKNRHIQEMRSSLMQLETEKAQIERLRIVKEAEMQRQLIDKQFQLLQKDREVSIKAERIAFLEEDLTQKTSTELQKDREVSRLLSEKDQKIAKLEVRVHSLEVDQTGLQRALRRLQQKQQEAAQKEREASEASHKIAQLETQKTELEREVRKHKGTVSQREREILRLQKHCRELRKKLRSLQVNVKSGQVDLSFTIHHSL